MLLERAGRLSPATSACCAVQLSAPRTAVHKSRSAHLVQALLRQRVAQQAAPGARDRSLLLPGILPLGLALQCCLREHAGRLHRPAVPREAGSCCMLQPWGHMRAPPTAAACGSTGRERCSFPDSMRNCKPCEPARCGVSCPAQRPQRLPPARAALHCPALPPRRLRPGHLRHAWPGRAGRAARPAGQGRPAWQIGPLVQARTGEPGGAGSHRVCKQTAVDETGLVAPGFLPRLGCSAGLAGSMQAAAGAAGLNPAPEEACLRMRAPPSCVCRGCKAVCGAAHPLQDLVPAQHQC